LRGYRHLISIIASSQSPGNRGFFICAEGGLVQKTILEKPICSLGDCFQNSFFYIFFAHSPYAGGAPGVPAAHRVHLQAAWGNRYIYRSPAAGRKNFAARRKNITQNACIKLVHVLQYRCRQQSDRGPRIRNHAEEGVSSMKEHLKCDCPRCEGYSPEWSCDEWDRPRGALEPDRLVHNCTTCRYNNSYGPYGCPVCYRVRRTLGLE